MQVELLLSFLSKASSKFNHLANGNTFPQKKNLPPELSFKCHPNVTVCKLIVRFFKSNS